MAKPIKQEITRRQEAIAPEGRSTILIEYSALRYDYDSQVIPERRQWLKDAAVDIRRRQHRAVEDLIVIGRRLLEAKDFLRHGQFQEWIGQEFAWSYATARRYMDVAGVVDGRQKLHAVQLLSDTVLYLYAASSTPPAARTRIEYVTAAHGRSITKAEARAIINEYKPPKPAPDPEPELITVAIESKALAAAGFLLQGDGQRWRYLWQQSAGAALYSDFYQHRADVFDAAFAALKAAPEATAVATTEAAGEPIDVEYTVMPHHRSTPPATDLDVALRRSTIRKLRAAALKGALKDYLEDEERDQLVAALTKALGGIE